MEHVDASVLPSAVVRIDRDRRILDASQLLLEWSGLPHAQIMGARFDEVATKPPGALLPDSEYLPAIAEITRADGSILPVLVAEGAADPEGTSHVVLYDAREQRAFRIRLQSQHTLTQRTQKRLELVIESSIAFSGISDERVLAEVLVDTAMSAYSAEQAAVYLTGGGAGLQFVAGTDVLAGSGFGAGFLDQARLLPGVVKISGIEAARARSRSVAAAFEATGIQSVIVAPIRQGAQLLGFLAVVFYHPRQFDEQASPLAEALAGQAARALSSLRFQQRLEHAALHDDTTGLPNRRLLEERSDSFRTSPGTLTAVLFVDLDGFKAVNDRLGHSVGDALLAEVAIRLQEYVRADDVVVRYGGDEFVIICDVLDWAVSHEIAERLLSGIRLPYSMLPPDLAIGASIGIAVGASETESIATERLVRAADEAMYLAKHAGGNQIAGIGIDLIPS